MIASPVRRQPERGVVMIIALIIVVILLIVAITVLGEASNSAASATSVETKSYAFNSADAAMSQAMLALDSNPNFTPGPCGTPSPNNVSSNCQVAMNQLELGSAQSPDPATNQNINVPSGDAYVYGSVIGLQNRRTYVEAIVTRVQPTSLPQPGLNGQNDIVDSYNNKTPIQSNVHANDAIYINGQPQQVQGQTAGYNVNQLPATGGQLTRNTIPAAGQTPFPTPAQMNLLKQEALNATQLGQTLSPAAAVTTCTVILPCQGNVYISGDLTLSNTSVTFSGGGTDYINGNVSISGNAGFLNNAADNVIVVSGTVTITGQSFYSNASNKGELIVFGTDTSTCVYTPGGAPPGSGCAIVMAGNSKPSGLVYAPFGSIILAGNGNQTGSADAGTTPNQSGGYIFLEGGGANGGFTSVASTPIAPKSPLWRITAYWEY